MNFEYELHGWKFYEQESGFKYLAVSPEGEKYFNESMINLELQVFEELIGSGEIDYIEIVQNYIDKNMLKPVRYHGIDSFNRPVFKRIGCNEYYAALAILFPYGESENEVLKKVSESDLEYYGTSFDTEPYGGKNSRLKIVRG